MNPIIPGFAPDPSIVLIEDTYYLVNSSFHLFPGLPIYKSKDLNNWTHIGNAIDKNNQLDMSLTTANVNDIMVTVGGLYAPTIRYHNGIFYIVCTNVVRKDVGCENFFVTSTDIESNKWSQPVFFDFRGIDTSIFFDEDGKVYIHGSYGLQGENGATQPTTIKQFEIDLKTGKALSETKEIWSGFNKWYTEGPHMYKKDGYYYLMVAEGGTYDEHMVSIARSKNVWGPFEGNPANPILTHFKSKHIAQCTGHADIFQDTKGEWNVVCLGTRWINDRFPLGRETFLTKAKWEKGEFPVVSQIEDSTILIDSNGTSLAVPEKTSLVDPQIIYIRNPEFSNFKLQNNNGVVITPTEIGLDDPVQSPSWIGFRQRSLNCAVSTHVHADSEATAEAGISVYKEEARFATLGFDFSSKSLKFRLVDRFRKVDKTIETKIEPFSDKIQLRVVCTTSTYSFQYKSGNSYITVEDVDTIHFTLNDFNGAVYGVYAIGKGQSIEFSHFECQSN